MMKRNFIAVSIALALTATSGLIPAEAVTGKSGETVAIGHHENIAAVMENTAKPKKETKEVTFSVGLHCENCVKKVTENISFEKGVKDLEVSLEKKTVRIVYDSSKTDEAKLAAAIEKLGYTVERMPEK